jgi:CheY-like chemotaxis protein
MPDTASKRVLVVEDERVVAKDLQQTLVRLGYEVPVTAASGDEAIQLAAQRCPDLVLMDIRIAGELDGIATAGILRQRFGVPVVRVCRRGDPGAGQAHRTVRLHRQAGEGG